MFRADALPEKFVGKKVKPGFVVEKGEGVNTHTIVEGDCEFDIVDGVLWLKVNTPTKIDHEEHHEQTLAPGIVYKEIENEFDYEEMESRKTLD